MTFHKEASNTVKVIGLARSEYHEIYGEELDADHKGWREDKRWCRAVCATCGARFIRARWRSYWETGTRCGACSKAGLEGYIWKVPNKKIAATIMALPKEKARRYAKWQLHMHNLGLNNE